MRLTLHYVRMGTLELVRYPAFSIPAVFFPVLAYVLFAVPYADDQPSVVMAGFVATALLAVCFFQFGVAIAVDRGSPWESFLRTLPVAPSVRLAARVGSALVFATVSGVLVVGAAIATTDASLSAGRWLLLVATLLLGSIPFALAGIALGYWVRPKAALPVANLLFMPLAYAGGLWGGPRHLPGVLATISPYLPTRQWGELLWAAVDGRFWAIAEIMLLFAFGSASALVAIWGYRHDEGERYT